MKAGFKPKLWTSKEWKDASPDAKTKGCGVEAMLDEWQKHCKKGLGAMTPEEAFKAWDTAKKLSAALTAASKKCDIKAQKDTLAAILEYKKRADSFGTFAQLAAAALAKRLKFAEGFTNNDKVLADKDVFKVFESYSRKTAMNWEVVHTYMLCKAKQYAKAVELYGENGKGEGLYNVRSAQSNKILYETFVTKARHDQKDVLKAIQDLELSMSNNLTDSRHYDVQSGFKSLLAWKALLAQKFPIKEFSVA